MNSSNPVAPTIFRKKPFGENVEGLSYFGDGSCIAKTVFKWRGVRGLRSGHADPTSCGTVRWAVQIPSPVRACRLKAQVEFVRLPHERDVKHGA
jgi:hypothetical protein